MPEYTVKSLLRDEPKAWKGPAGTIYYHSVMVEEHPKALSVGKKEPNSIKVGDKIYGDITETDYMEDKFKAAQRPQSSPSSDNQYLKDLSDLPLRVYMASVGLFDTQALVKGGTYYTEFVEYIQNISNELLSMAENIRKGEVKDPTKVAKTVFKEKEPLPEMPPEDLGNDDYPE